jgi:hypothetical protein
MRLYEVTNGYMGESYVRCLVVAESPEQAIELARPKYAEKALGRDNYTRGLNAECLCPDVSQPWAGEVTDG